MLSDEDDEDEEVVIGGGGQGKPHNKPKPPVQGRAPKPEMDDDISDLSDEMDKPSKIPVRRPGTASNKPSAPQPPPVESDDDF